jgi:hypothetical protein
MREMIRNGQLDVAEAQRAIADDWTAAYSRFYSPSSRERARRSCFCE